MKIAIAQQNYHIGNFDANTEKIIEGIQKARESGADLVIFSELCVCGYPPRDFLEFDDFIGRCEAVVEEIMEFADGIGVLIGAPSRNEKSGGKDLFNSAYLLYNKEIQGRVDKTLLPNYDVFDEYRYFEPASEWALLQFKGKKMAVMLCEDMWNMGSNPQYRITPMEKLAPLGPDIIINLSASPFNYTQDVVRNSIMKAHSLKYRLPVVYCNTVGAQTEIVFDGGSLIYDNAGRKVYEAAYFSEDFKVVEWDELVLPEKSGLEEKPGDVFFSAAEVRAGRDTLEYLTDEKNIEEIHQALILGIRNYFSKMGFSKAILGASGGIDSALTQALAVEALGRENVRAILMPSQFSTGHSVDDARQLCINLRNPYDIIAIEKIYDAFLKELQPVFGDLPFGLAEENVQSRSRGNLLMAIANKFGYILLNTSNKSELATGYGTLYGDMAGGLGILGDVYKTQVYALAKFLNREKEIIPSNILLKPPSAELRPGQKDIDSLPEYDELDNILFQYIEDQRGPSEIVAQGFDEKLVARILKLVNTNEYKRNQFCPIIRVSYKAFGIGRRMPIVGKYLSE